MMLSKFSTDLIELLLADNRGLVTYAADPRYDIFVVTEDDNLYSGRFTLQGLRELSQQSWVKRIWSANST